MAEIKDEIKHTEDDYAVTVTIRVTGDMQKGSNALKGLTTAIENVLKNG